MYTYFFIRFVQYGIVCNLLQGFQALVHFQNISQYRGSRILNSIPFKTVKESTCSNDFISKHIEHMMSLTKLHSDRMLNTFSDLCVIYERWSLNLHGGAVMPVWSQASVTYFSVFKLWFTLRASASTETPESSILFSSRL